MKLLVSNLFPPLFAENEEPGSMRKFFENVSLKRKIVLLFTLFSIIPIGIIGVISITKINNYVYNSMQAYINQTADSVNTNVNLSFDEATTLLKVSKSYEALSFINSTRPDDIYENAKAMVDVFSDLRTVQKDNSHIVDMILIGINGNCISEKNGYYLLDNGFESYDSIKSVLEDPREYHIIAEDFPNSVYNNYKNNIYVATAVFKIGTNEVCGVLAIGIDKDFIQEILDSSKLSDECSVAIINKAGEIIFSDYDYSSSAVVDKVVSKNEPTGIFRSEDDLVVFNTLASTGWKVIYTTPISTVRAPSYQISMAIVAAIFVSIFMAFVINSTISESLTRPIKKLSVLMEGAAKGNLDIYVPTSGNDEISQLYRSFDKMVKDIKSLLSTVIEDQENMKRSELKTLQAQINPHFLYNTLDSVLWAAENNQNKQVIDLIIALSKFYKLTLGKGFEAVSVASEAEHIQSYLTIMSMRYADILEYEVSVDESVTNGLFPPIILQPIVENCIYHGIKNKRFGQNEKGMVTIGITRHDEEKIMIRISDNGTGMEPEFLSRLKDCLEQNGASKSGGYGLINVKQRLNLFFGRDISFNITSRKDFGTEFEIIVPYKEN